MDYPETSGNLWKPPETGRGGFLIFLLIKIYLKKTNIIIKISETCRKPEVSRGFRTIHH
jgi:hypothetical protein